MTLHKIVSINKPDPYLIAHIEKTLEMAKKGEMVGIVEFILWNNNTTSSGWSLAGEHHLHIDTIIGQFQLAITKLCNIDQGIISDIDHLKDILDA